MILAGGLSNPSDQVRFFREGETLAKFSHPNFVQIYEMGALQLPTGPQPYLILDYVDGGNLHPWVEGKSLPASEAAALVLVLARAMDVAPQTGIVHRDLEPASILLRPESHTTSGKRKSFEGPWITLTRGKEATQRFVPKTVISNYSCCTGGDCSFNSRSTNSQACPPFLTVPSSCASRSPSSSFL